MKNKTKNSEIRMKEELEVIVQFCFGYQYLDSVNMGNPYRIGNGSLPSNFILDLAILSFSQFYKSFNARILISAKDTLKLS